MSVSKSATLAVFRRVMQVRLPPPAPTPLAPWPVPPLPGHMPHPSTCDPVRQVARKWPTLVEKESRDHHQTLREVAYIKAEARYVLYPRGTLFPPSCRLGYPRKRVAASDRTLIPDHRSRCTPPARMQRDDPEVRSPCASRREAAAGSFRVVHYQDSPHLPKFPLQSPVGNDFRKFSYEPWSSLTRVDRLF